MPYHSVYPSEEIDANQLRGIVQSVLDNLPNLQIIEYNPLNWSWEWEYGKESMSSIMKRLYSQQDIYYREQSVHDAIIAAQHKFPHNVDANSERTNGIPEMPAFPKKWSTGYVEICRTWRGPNGEKLDHLRLVVVIIRLRGDTSSHIVSRAIKSRINGEEEEKQKETPR